MPKYYTYNKTHKLYQIKKRINGTWNYFGYYRTPEEAEEIVELLKTVNWEKEKLPPEIQEKINKPISHCVHFKNTGKYGVRKNGRNFGTYPTKEEAREIVELLEKNNWRTSNLTKEELKKLHMPIKCETGKYYYHDKNTDNYRIYKCIDGKSQYFGTYETESKVKKVVELLKQNNWDRSALN